MAPSLWCAAGYQPSLVWLRYDWGIARATAGAIITEGCDRRLRPTRGAALRDCRLRSSRRATRNGQGSSTRYAPEAAFIPQKWLHTAYGLHNQLSYVFMQRSHHRQYSSTHSMLVFCTCVRQTLEHIT